MASCVLCLCALPGAGKSSLVQMVVNESASGGLLSLSAARPVLVHVLDLDAIYEALVASGDKTAFNSVEWRSARRQAYQAGESFLREAADSATLRVLIVDDNMYYRSMRHAYFRLAATYKASYVQLFVDVRQDVALERNAARPPERCVPEDILRRMASRLEPPRPDENAWESRTLVLDNNDPDGLDKERFPWGDLAALCLAPPLPRPPSPSIALAASAASRAETLASFWHQAELRVRRVVSECLARVREAGGDMRAAAAALAEAKKKFLADLHAGAYDDFLLFDEPDRLDSALETTSTLFQDVATRAPF